MRTPLPWVLALCAATSALPAQDRFQGSEGPPTAGRRVHYVGNRPPLVPNRLLSLPPGDVRPLGWLRYQCQGLADGMTGRLDAISRFCRRDGNAWVDPAGMGHSPWEEVPYWLRSLTHLAYVMDDPLLKAKALSWLRPIMANQRANGYFGTEENLKDGDLWPNMLVLDAVRVHHEATGDPAVIAFMEAYFAFQRKIPPDLFLYRSWQKVRGGNNLDSIYWLYNRTGGEGLLELAELNHKNTARWYRYIPTPHGVNIAQAFREPAMFYQQNRDRTYLESAYEVYRSVMAYFGRVPGGMFGADEVCRQGYDGPRQCAETCTMMEFIASHAFLSALTGDPKWADRCEDVAFNSLPAAFAPDLRGLRYLTAPNQPQADRSNKRPLINNDGEMFTFRADLYRCCNHNAAFGWVSFAENLYLATRDGGLAAMLYAPCRVSARVGGSGRRVVLLQRTGYPFRDTVEIEVVSGGPERFPLYLRVPSWCRKAEFWVNGVPAGSVGGEAGWARVERTFRSGDVVKARFPMRVEILNFDQTRAGFSIMRGALAYSIRIGEDWRKRGETKGFPRYEVFPSTPWNYSPVDGPLEVVERPFPVNGQAFTPDQAPVILRTKGRRVPSWGLEKNGLVQEIGAKPMMAAPGTEDITLVPMGSARLRISVFPKVE
jgi:hypothetical protein